MEDINKEKHSVIIDVKAPITYDEQVKRIIAKGFVVEDINSCKGFLKQANYYRLLAYYLPFKKKDGTYFQGIPFKRIQQIYEFDSHLRCLLFVIIEQIEFYLRTQISYYLSFKYGALGYLDNTMFNPNHHNDERFKENIATIIDDNKRTPVVKHHNQKYDGNFPL